MQIAQLKRYRDALNSLNGNVEMQAAMVASHMIIHATQKREWNDATNASLAALTEARKDDVIVLLGSIVDHVESIPNLSPVTRDFGRATATALLAFASSGIVDARHTEILLRPWYAAGLPNVLDEPKGGAK